MPLGQQCVLFRSMYLSIPLQSELSKRNIPYETYGGIKFYETAHVKDILAHLKVLVNPKDELAWNRLLMLIERIGPKTAQVMTDEATACSSLGEILEKVFPKYSARYSYSEGLANLAKTLYAASDEELNAGEKFEIALDYYIPRMKNSYDDWHLRMNDLDALRQVAMRYDSLEDLLDDFAVEPPERGVWGVEPETKEEEKPLALSTIHSAKGLEWDSVVIMGLADGILPVTFSLDSEDEIEEEQRLFYVAVTRARKRCCLTLHHEGVRGGITQFNKVSRFVDASNVREKLEFMNVSGPGLRGLSTEWEGREDFSLYDKKRLLERILNSYK